MIIKQTRKDHARFVQRLGLNVYIARITIMETSMLDSDMNAVEAFNGSNVFKLTISD